MVIGRSPNGAATRFGRGSFTTTTTTTVVHEARCSVMLVDIGRPPRELTVKTLAELRTRHG